MKDIKEIERDKFGQDLSEIFIKLPKNKIEIEIEKEKSKNDKGNNLQRKTKRNNRRNEEGN